MSLATRCPACGTIFRVVQDQLKVSEGWVRCGQCHEVFHGIEALFDLDSDPAIAARRSARAPAPAPFAPTEPAGLSGFGAPAATPGPAPTPMPPRVEAPRPAAAVPSPAPVVAPPPPVVAPPSPVAAPTPIGTPMMRRTIAPRFAARLAEESARARGTPLPSSPIEPTFIESPPPGHAPGVFAPAQASRVEDEPPLPAIEAFAPAPPAREPRTIVAPRENEASASMPADEIAAPASRTGPTIPSRPAEDADDEDEGPLTLASMLPDASEWPRRAEPRQRTRRRGKPPAASSAAASAAAQPPAIEGGPALESTHHARFVREAHRDARWSRPWVRAVLSVALVALAVGAAAQVAWPMRDVLAARYHATRPAWEMLCEQLGCTIEAPRALASLSLDGSSLTRTNTEHVLLFSADLHNRADHEVRAPSFDLTFMDLNGEIVARKVLTPEQIGIAQKSLAPEAELHVHARLQVGTLDASGFQADMFYP